MLTDLHFLRPWWFLALIPLVVLLLALVRSRRVAQAWRSVVDEHLLPHLLVGSGGQRQWLPLVLLGAGWLLGVVALAGPVWQHLPQPVFSAVAQRVILLDLSPTMNVADVAPSRLGRARFEILDLLRGIKEGQVALIAFGSEPYLVSPLTTDAHTIAVQVPQLSSDLLPVYGVRRTDLALQQAQKLLGRVHAEHADVILVTDGVGGLGGSLQAAHDLKAQGHHLSVLAVGTLQGGPIPAPGGGFEQDAQGKTQMAPLERARLQQLARAGDGRYLEAQVGDADTRALLDMGKRLDTEVQQTALSADQWREEGPWLLLLILPLAALAFRRGWLLPVVLVCLVLPPVPGHAASWTDLWLTPDQQGARSLAAGQAEQASGEFADPAWQAAAAYRAGKYEQALKALEGVHGADADYNRGNALTRLGRYDAAISAYQQALKQDPQLVDAQQNLDLVRRLREQQQQPPPQSGSSGKDKDQDSSDKDRNQDSGTSGGQQSPSSPGSKSSSQSGQSSPGSSSGSQGSAGQQGSSQSGQSSPDTQNPQSAGEHGQSAAQPSSGSGKSAPQPAPAPGASDLQPRQGQKAGQVQSAQEQNPAAQTRKASAGKAPEAGEDARAGVSTQSAQKPDSAQSTAGGGVQSAQEREKSQAMETQLRRVPDDPGGLLRQRFLLQHLRREGQLQ